MASFRKLGPSIVNNAFASVVAGNWSKSTGICPEPGCGKPMEVMVNYETLAAMPALMALEPLIICNDCADFRQTLRDAETIACRIMQNYRKHAITVNAESQIQEVIQDKLDRLNAEYRPLVDSATRRILGILAQRTGMPIVDVAGFSAQLMMNQWEQFVKYGGEKLIRVAQVDSTYPILCSIRAKYGIVLKHHGRTKTGKIRMEEPEL